MIRVPKSTREWIRGLIAAFISGGAGSVGTGITLNMIDPDHYNLSQAHLMLKAMLIAFLLHAIIGVMMFLAKNPLPPEVDSDEPNPPKVPPNV